MNIPSNFKKILEKDQTLQAEVLSIVTTFEPIVKDRLFFFEEYTDHGIEHIEKVLKATEFLIPEDSFQWIKPQEVAILLLSTLLHDIGMHIEFATFKALLDGVYNDVKIDIIDNKIWPQLWDDYLSEVKHFSSNQKEKIWGNPDQQFHVPDLTNIDNLNGADKKLIGEFIRRHHARLAHEIALKGFVGNSGVIAFGTNSAALPELYKQLAGITARSHGINIRNTFDYLEEIAYDSWKNPNDINIGFLMVTLRIADYLQIDSSRTNPRLLKVKTFSSPLSQKEHKAHLAITGLNFTNDDPELIGVNCDPKDAQMYVKLESLINDIQNELDLSWAILGEIYGKLDRSPQIKFRRIKANLKHPKFLSKIDYVPKQVSFKVNNELSKLLVAPLYGDDPKYGVRELVQNATDACKERLKIEQDLGNQYEPQITVSIDKIDDDKHLFKIKDNGKGMSLDEIIKYFLNVGSSFRKSFDWKNEFTSEEGNVLVNRNGRFGVGVLAAFLLGDEIEVKTKSCKANSSYIFKTKIDSLFIEVRKTLLDEVGTEITIALSNERYNQLIPAIYNRLNTLTSKEKVDTIKWNNWYLEDIPPITYLINGKIITREYKSDLIKDSVIREIEVTDFGKVHWFYTQIGINRNMVMCNGIIITKQSKYNKFENYSNFNVIKSIPNLIIEDPKGLFPLKLDRNDMDCKKLPFEEELIYDISKDIIAHILTLELSRRLYLDYRYNAKILFSKNGYTVDIDYFINKVKANYRLVRIISSSNKISSHLFSDKCLIIFNLNEEIKLSKQEDNVAPKQGGIILLKKDSYYNLFKDEKARRLNLRIKEKHKYLWENEKFVIYRLYDFSEEALYVTKELADSLSNDKNTSIQSIQEIPFNTYSSKKSGDILHELFEIYFGNNVVIPYKIEDRKRLYPKAFEELKDYMGSYINLERLDDLMEST